MIDNMKPWEDHCRIIKMTSGRLKAMSYSAAELWIDYKPLMSESASRANEAIRNMMQSATTDK